MEPRGYGAAHGATHHQQGRHFSADEAGAQRDNGEHQLEEGHPPIDVSAGERLAHQGQGEAEVVAAEKGHQTQGGGTTHDGSDRRPFQIAPHAEPDHLQGAHEQPAEQPERHAREEQLERQADGPVGGLHLGSKAEFVAQGIDHQLAGERRNDSRQQGTPAVVAGDLEGEGDAGEGHSEERTPPPGEGGGDEGAAVVVRESGDRGSGVGDRSRELEGGPFAADRGTHEVSGDRPAEDQRRHPGGHPVGEDVGLLDDCRRAALRPSTPVEVGGSDDQAHRGEQPHQPAVGDAGACGPVEGLQEGVGDQPGEPSADGREHDEAGAGEHRPPT